VEKKFCNETNLGEYLLSFNSQQSHGSIQTKAINLLDPQPFRYAVNASGYYCVGTEGFTIKEYSGIVQFRNAYGALPAAQIAKLPFYGALAIVYIVIGAFWGFLYAQHRHDVLPVQNYITAIIIFLIFEMSITTGFYDYENQHGSNVGTKIFMIIVSVLNAGRNSFSFFLLLIVCMGYGVVKPSLGKTMWWVRALALGHFIFGVIYAVASLAITPETAGPVVLFVILPLAGTLTAFYVWTLNSLNQTMKDLMDRRQHVKAMMYKKLWWGIFGSIVVIFGFFFLNSFTFAGASSPDFVPDHWRTRWFVLDGWLNLVYLCDIAYIAYLWRPTANNRRFAMSDEVSLKSKYMRSLLTCHSLLKMTMGSRSLHMEALLTKRKERVHLMVAHLYRHTKRQKMAPSPTLDIRSMQSPFSISVMMRATSGQTMKIHANQKNERD
jgi:hypothetical protein